MSEQSRNISIIFIYSHSISPTSYPTHILFDDLIFVFVIVFILLILYHYIVYIIYILCIIMFYFCYLICISSLYWFLSLTLNTTTHEQNITLHNIRPCIWLSSRCCCFCCLVMHEHVLTCPTLVSW
jgi:hypothetical protein